MASQPEDLPESIFFAASAGLRNVVSEERLQVGELSIAKNIDIDEVGQVRRRRGQTQVDSASWHSVENVGAHLVGVRDGDLGFIGEDYSHAALASVGDNPLSYTLVDDTIYYASDTTHGKIVSGAVTAWGESNAGGQWLSPVQTPTETLGAISGKNLTPPQHASLIEAYKGRIYMGAANVLWATELYLYDLVDRTRNFVPLEHPITMLRAMEDGLFVGTTHQLLFLAGTMQAGLRKTVVMNQGVVRGSDVRVPLTGFGPAQIGNAKPEGKGITFMADGGIYLGVDGGAVSEMTSHVEFPAMSSAAALYRNDQGATSYLVSGNSRGTPTGDMRFGDYADAEIVRASQGGISSEVPT